MQINISKTLRVCISLNIQQQSGYGGGGRECSLVFRTPFHCVGGGLRDVSGNKWELPSARSGMARWEMRVRQSTAASLSLKNRPERGRICCSAIVPFDPAAVLNQASGRGRKDAQRPTAETREHRAPHVPINEDTRETRARAHAGESLLG